MSVCRGVDNFQLTTPRFQPGETSRLGEPYREILVNWNTGSLPSLSLPSIPIPQLSLRNLNDLQADQIHSLSLFALTAAERRPPWLLGLDVD